MNRFSNSIRAGGTVLALVVLSACQSPNSEETALTPTPTVDYTNTGDNVERASGTGTTAAVGFSETTFPASRTGIGQINSTFGDASAVAPSVLSGVAAPINVHVLGLDSTTSTLTTVDGVYDPATLSVTATGNSYEVASNGNAFTGQLISGGENQTLIARTTPINMPTSGSAVFVGTSDVIYVNGPTSQTFTGTMAARVTARFDSALVDIDLTNPNGQIDGRAYNQSGHVNLDDLAISGDFFTANGASSGSVTGFVGAAGLNSGSQIVQVRGIFGGPTASETGAVIYIDDGDNGVAAARLTATR